MKKLTADDVYAIRLLNFRYKAPLQMLAEKFDVHYDTIRQITAGRTWDKVRVPSELVNAPMGTHEFDAELTREVEAWLEINGEISERMKRAIDLESVYSSGDALIRRINEIEYAKHEVMRELLLARKRRNMSIEELHGPAEELDTSAGELDPKLAARLERELKHGVSFEERHRDVLKKLSLTDSYD